LKNIVAISSARKDNLMDRRSNKSLEGTTKPTERPKDSNFSRKLLLEKYTCHESTDDQRELHGDPRSELAQRQHQDSDVTPSDEDGDHESLHPAFGFGTTPELSASDPSASDQGTLAGGLFHASAPQLGKRPLTNALLDGAVKRGGH
jgi:hypothetical protein